MNADFDPRDFWINIKGMAYVRDKKDFIKFVYDLNEEGAPLHRDESWLAFFCPEYFASISIGLSEGMITLKDVSLMITPDRFPAKYPAFITFDFEKYYGDIMEDTAIWLTMPAVDLGVREIETEKNDYVITYCF